MEAKIKEVVSVLDGTVIRNKAELIEAFRKSSYDEDAYDMLAAFLGGNLEEDPLGFYINATIRYCRSPFTRVIDVEERSDPVGFYMRKYPNATRRAISYVPMSGEAFYEKYGAEKVCKYFDTLCYRNGVHLYDLFEMDNDEDVKIIVSAGKEFKERIMWEIATDWIDDICDSLYMLSGDDVAAICGDE